MTDFFFYGTLRHKPLLALVLGKETKETAVRFGLFVFSKSNTHLFRFVAQELKHVAQLFRVDFSISVG